MLDIASEVVSIADACLGGLQGRVALIIGSDEWRHQYSQLLKQARMKNVFQDTTPGRIQMFLPHVQLLISLPGQEHTPMITAASVAQSCEGRRIPLLIFDLAISTSVEDLAGLLPAVCLYTPEDMRRILGKVECRAS